MSQNAAQVNDTAGFFRFRGRKEEIPGMRNRPVRKHTPTMNMTEGKPLKLLSVFALPLLIGNLFQQAYNLADSMIVGQMLGANALAAVGATGSISFLFFSIFNGISGGCGIVTAQFFGAKKDELVYKAIANSAYITLVFSLLTGTIAFIMVPTVLAWMGTPAEIVFSCRFLHSECRAGPAVYRRLWHGRVRSSSGHHAFPAAGRCRLPALCLPAQSLFPPE